MSKTNGFSKVFFISDTHFGHSNIIKYCHRPFLCLLDQEELNRLGGTWNNGNWKGEDSNSYRISSESVHMMNDNIINNINDVVGPNDTLWHLGDFAFAPKQDYYYKCREYRDRINCRNVNIIWGNHDQPNVIRNLFNEAHFLTNITVNKQKIVLCHYAMALWDCSHRKSIHLYGHSHSTAENWLDQTFPNRRSMDVGVDNAYKLLGKFRPFSFEEIIQFVGNRPGQNVGNKNIDPNSPKEEELL